MLPGVIGTIQANEALKIIVGYGDPLVGRLLTFDAQSTSFGELKPRRDPECPTCGVGAGNGRVGAPTPQPVTAGVATASSTGEACSV